MSTEESWKIALQFVSVGFGLVTIIVNGILTIWGPDIRRRLAGPRLSVNLLVDHPVRKKDHPHTDGTVIPMYFYHLRVSNTRKSAPAENVKVLVKSLFKGADAHFFPVPISGEIQLAWEYTQGTPQPRTIGSDHPHKCDLGYLEPPGFRLKTYFDPDDFDNRLGPRETMRVEIQAVAYNAAASKPLWLEIYWTGEWPRNEGDIGKHVIVKEIPPGSQNRTS
ncbi:MAG: hypothetical protein JOZ45_15235 [Acidobacteriaceae bacterium]|nr:hypothetical protein [Acidobacteriaceae bacterium]